jgi:hypothetical protein
VLPPVALASLPSVDVVLIEIVVPVKIIVVVNVHVAVVPIAIAPVATSPRTQCKSRCAPRQPHAWVVTRISIRVIGIGRRSSAVHHHGIVRRHVNHIGLSWLDRDHLVAALDCFGLHCLLRAGF